MAVPTSSPPLLSPPQPVQNNSNALNTYELLLDYIILVAEIEYYSQLLDYYSELFAQ